MGRGKAENCLPDLGTEKLCRAANELPARCEASRKKTNRLPRNLPTSPQGLVLSRVCSHNRPLGLASGEHVMLERLEKQKKLTANQWKIIATANVGDMLDFFDFFLIGYVLAFILKEWQLTYGQSAVILVSAGLGAVPGAFFWGWMGDRIGRRKVFILTALNVALATGIMYFTPGQGGWIAGWIFLSFFRFFVGFGNAGLIAVDIPLVQEFVPAYKRGWVSGLTTTLLPAGNILGAVSGAFLAPVIGWRGLFLVGLVPALLVLMIRYWVPESPRFLMRMGRHEEARKSLAWALQCDPARSSCRPRFPRWRRPRGANCSNIRAA